MPFLLVIVSLINRPKCHASIKLKGLIAKAVLAHGAYLLCLILLEMSVVEILTLHVPTFVR